MTNYVKKNNDYKRTYVIILTMISIINGYTDFSMRQKKRHSTCLPQKTVPFFYVRVMNV